MPYNTVSSPSSSSAESDSDDSPPERIKPGRPPNPRPGGEKKRKKASVSAPLAPAARATGGEAEGMHVCVTCGRTDSPEWRKGPLGPKTLCNVRLPGSDRAWS